MTRRQLSKAEAETPAAAFIFAVYHHAAEKAEFERLCRQYHAVFAPLYQPRFALPAGRNKIYACRIAGKPGLIKIGQTAKKTEERILSQPRTADIYIRKFYGKFMRKKQKARRSTAICRTAF